MNNQQKKKSYQKQDLNDLFEDTPGMDFQNQNESQDAPMSDQEQSIVKKRRTKKEIEEDKKKEQQSREKLQQITDDCKVKATALRIKQREMENQKKEELEAQQGKKKAQYYYEENGIPEIYHQDKKVKLYEEGQTIYYDSQQCAELLIMGETKTDGKQVDNEQIEQEDKNKFKILLNKFQQSVGMKEDQNLNKSIIGQLQLLENEKDLDNSTRPIANQWFEEGISYEDIMILVKLLKDGDYGYEKMFKQDFRWTWSNQQLQKMYGSDIDLLDSLRKLYFQFIGLEDNHRNNVRCRIYTALYRLQKLSHRMKDQDQRLIERQIMILQGLIFNQQTIEILRLFIEKYSYLLQSQLAQQLTPLNYQSYINPAKKHQHNFQIINDCIRIKQQQEFDELTIYLTGWGFSIQWFREIVDEQQEKLKYLSFLFVIARINNITFKEFNNVLSTEFDICENECWKKRMQAILLKWQILDLEIKTTVGEWKGILQKSKMIFRERIEHLEIYSKETAQKLLKFWTASKSSTFNYEGRIINQAMHHYSIRQKQGQKQLLDIFNMYKEENLMEKLSIAITINDRLIISQQTFNECNTDRLMLLILYQQRSLLQQIELMKIIESNISPVFISLKKFREQLLIQSKCKDGIGLFQENIDQCPIVNMKKFQDILLKCSSDQSMMMSFRFQLAIRIFVEYFNNNITKSLLEFFQYEGGIISLLYKELL